MEGRNIYLNCRLFENLINAAGEVSILDHRPKKREKLDAKIRGIEGKIDTYG